MLKVVIDTNLWVSALLTHGKPRELINHFEGGRFIAIYPQWLILELRKIPSKQKLAAITQADIENLVTLIKKISVLVEPEHVPSVSRDPKDDVFLACAAAAKADFLVTGNKKDLLHLGAYGGTRIVTAAQFLQILIQHT